MADWATTVCHSALFQSEAPSEAPPDRAVGAPPSTPQAPRNRRLATGPFVCIRAGIAPCRPRPTHSPTTSLIHSYWLAKSGDITTALTEIEQVIHDYTATLGPTHPNTLISRHNHADWLAQTGDIDTALQVTRRIVVDLDDAGGGDPLRYALTVTAQLAVRCGLHHVGENLADANVADLLRRVAMRSDARAFAALPA